MWTILLGGLAIYTVFFIIESIILINYPYQISYGEGFILNQAVIISQGQSIYQDITNYPYLVGNYPPVYSFLCALFVKIFGVSFAPGRFISFIAVILSGFLIYIILKKNRRSQKGSFKESIVISALFFLASPYIFYAYPLYRVDALALLFSLAGLYFVFKFENRKSVYFSIPFFILALYTKQSFIAAPIASLIYLTFKNIKRGIIYFIFLSLVYVSIFLLLNNLTGGQYCLHNFTYNANAFSILFAIRMCVSALQIHAILFTFAFAYIVHVIIRKKLSLFAIYLIITALMAISIGKIGSGINYFGELVACSCIILGIFLNETEFTNKESKNILIVTGLLLQLILFA
ncbi:MAG: glycosyltransferase family 39 protein, partial [Bacteroidales bacterium]|nr:glycosyltransferase family 39 protein [Bacteroidales bacterium]